MGKEGRAWHQQQDTKVRAPGAQTISTELLFSPLWRWARKGSGPSLPPQPKPSTGPPPSKHLSPPARCCDQCGAGVLPLPGAAFQPLPRPGGGAFSNLLLSYCGLGLFILHAGLPAFAFCNSGSAAAAPALKSDARTLSRTSAFSLPRAATSPLSLRILSLIVFCLQEI